jgi:hypothetical protein
MHRSRSFLPVQLKAIDRVAVANAVVANVPGHKP